MTGGATLVDAMKIQVMKVPEEGLSLDTSYDPQQLNVDRQDAHLTSPVRLATRVTREGEDLFVQGSLRCVLTMICGRCLESFDATVDKELLLHYDVTGKYVVDITDDVRQELVLEYPMIALCRSDCLGLCPRCGVNRNHTTCSCNA
ncbi:MAG: DUF177 domain-containing protein [Candidatus Omnitrophica bacterium]|nr:DUF177 domain-containing protein [Candidatus Omnitrophota bacterium]